MLYVTLVLAAVLFAGMSAFAGLLRSLQRTQARERELLVNQILHMAGNAWQPAPAAIRVEEAPLDADEWWRRHEPAYSATPEQDPEF